MSLDILARIIIALVLLAVGYGLYGCNDGFARAESASTSWRAFAYSCEPDSIRFKTGVEGGAEGKHVRTFVALCEQRSR